MRLLWSVAACAGVLCCNTYAGKIQFETFAITNDVYRITYTVENIPFPVNRALDIQFDPATYVHLSDETAPSGFDALVLQPDNPPGAPGVLSVMALLGFPDFSGEFSLTVQTAGNIRPGPQSFVINQLDEHGVILSRISSGETVDSTVPEPATLPLTCAALLGGCVVGALRYVRKQLA